MKRSEHVGGGQESFTDCQTETEVIHVFSKKQFV